MSLKNTQRFDSRYDYLIDLLGDFGKSIEEQSNKILILDVKPESELPLSKNKIKYSLFTLALLEQDGTALQMILAAYRFLNDYVTDELYNYFHNKLGVTGEYTVEDAENIMEKFKNENDDFMKKFEQVLNMKNEEAEQIENEINLLLKLLQYSVAK